MSKRSTSCFRGKYTHQVKNNYTDTFFAVIELACGEHGEDKITAMVNAMQNGKNLSFLEDGQSLPTLQQLRGKKQIKYFD